MIASCFETNRPLAIEKDSEPEITGEWITVRVSAGGEMERVLDGYDDITRRLVDILPAEVARKLKHSVGIA